MPDLLKAFEKAAKAVRGGILAASDNLAFLVSDACRTPVSAAGSPPNSVAVVAPSPKQGSDSGSEEIAPIWRRPSEPHPDFRPDGLLQRARLLRILMDVSGAHDGYTVDMEDWNCVCGAPLDTEYFRPNEAHRRHVAQQQSTAVIEAHQQK